MLILARHIGEHVYIGHHPGRSFRYAEIKPLIQITVLAIQDDFCHVQITQTHAVTQVLWVRSGEWIPLKLYADDGYPSATGRFGLREIRRQGPVDGHVSRPQVRFVFDCPRSMAVFRHELLEK